jgi:uncharacterized membrane protein YfcA
MILKIIILAIFSLFAFSISAVAGGGAGLILIPILGNLLQPAFVPAALSIGTSFSSASRIFIFYKNINWDLVKYFIPGSIPAVWLGSWLLQYINPLYLQSIMGIFLVTNLLHIFKNESSETSETKSKSFITFIGFLVGFLSSLTGAVGVLFNSFYLGLGMKKEEIVATRAMNEITIHILKLALYFYFGLMTRDVVYFGGCIALTAVISSWIMKWVLPRISLRLFKNIGYTAMVISGISILYTSVSKIALEKNLAVNLYPIQNGMESKFHWSDSDFSIEFVYDEGFEYERIIRLEELPEDKQDFVKEKIYGSDSYAIEEVFGFKEHSYELYLNKNGKIIKMDFPD